MPLPTTNDNRQSYEEIFATITHDYASNPCIIPRKSMSVLFVLEQTLVSDIEESNLSVAKRSIEAFKAAIMSKPHTKQRLEVIDDERIGVLRKEADATPQQKTRFQPQEIDLPEQNKQLLVGSVQGSVRVGKNKEMMSINAKLDKLKIEAQPKRQTMPRAASKTRGRKRKEKEEEEEAEEEEESEESDESGSNEDNAEPSVPACAIAASVAAASSHSSAVTTEQKQKKRNSVNKLPNHQNEEGSDSSAEEDTEETNSDDDVSLSTANFDELQKTAQRKRRRVKIPLTSENLLRNWFRANVANPYPTEEQKRWFMNAGNLDAKQVVNWFTNTRKRFWLKHPTNPQLNQLVEHRVDRIKGVVPEATKQMDPSTSSQTKQTQREKQSPGRNVSKKVKVKQESQPKVSSSKKKEQNTKTLRRERCENKYESVLI